MSLKLPKSINREDFELILNQAIKDRESFRKKRSKKLTQRGKRINQYIIAMIFGFGAGLRISEIVGYIDRIPPFTKDRIEGNHLRILGKGKKERIVPLPIKLFRKAGITRKEIEDNLPLNISRRAAQLFITTLCKNVLKKHTTFHQLRHGFVTHALESGVDIHDVQRFAGHSRLDTTGLYLHSNPKRALDKYEEVF